MNWYEFTPVDTLFFKGAQPMNLGENHTASHIFPPPARTLTGALRTAVLIQNHIDFKNYNGKKKVPATILDAIGESDKPAPFSLTGPLFMVKKQIYVPAPYTWFMEKDCKSDTISVIRGKYIKTRLMKSGTNKFFWARGKNGNLVSLGGMWIEKDDFFATKEEIKVKEISDFFANEPRTGIALEKSRKIRKHHIYSFNHIRLQKDVSIVFGVDRDLPIAEKGVLKIGAEQRFGWYQRLNDKVLQFKNNGLLYSSLSIVEDSAAANEAVVSTGRIIYLGGWDMNKGFHKPMTGFFPAGTVFNKKINNNCIAIKEA